MKKIIKKTSLVLMLLFAMVLTTVSTYAAAVNKGQGQTLILNQTLGIAGSRSVVEVFGTKGGGTVRCISESTYSRAYQAYPEDGWVFVGWSTYFDGVLSEGGNSTIGFGDDWLFSKVGNKEAKCDYYATTIQANFELNVDLQIYAVFKPTIKVSTGANGYAPGDAVRSVNYGGSSSIQFNPSAGYEINNITVDIYNSVSLTDSDRAKYTYTFTNVTDKHTIYADFRPITYKVAYEGNGSTSGSMNAQEFSYGTSQKLNVNTFKKTGYTFAGWNTQANGQGTSYTDSQEVNNLTTEKGTTITLYAQWKPAALTGTVQIAGEKIMGKVLTASVTNTNNTGVLSYKWQRDGVDIAGATTRAYTLTEKDIGKTLKVIVTSSVQTGSISGTISDIVANALEGAVEISGEKIMGKTLTASVTNTNNTGVLSYKWQRDGVDIEGATASTYTLTEKDIGKTLKVIVTSSVQTGSISGTVSDIVADALEGTVEISGEKRVGKTLTAKVTNTNNTGVLSYKWQRDGVDIEGATTSTYKLTGQDVGKTLKVIVTSSVQTSSINGVISDITDKVNVEYDLTNITTDGETQATYLTDYVTTLLPIAEYKLPQTIIVTVDGVELTTDKYTYDITLAKLTIPAASVTGNIKITAEAVAMEKYTVTIQEAEHVTITPSGVMNDVLEGSNLDVEIKVEKGYELKFVEVNGVEQELPLLEDVLTLNNINENITVVVKAVKKTSNPQTGDNILLFVVIFVVAVIGATVTLILRKRVNKN